MSKKEISVLDQMTGYFANIATSETAITELTANAIKKAFAGENLDLNHLNNIFASIEIADNNGHVRSNQRNALVTFINTFIGVELKKEDGKVYLTTDNKVVLKKSEAKMRKVIKTIMLATSPEGTPELTNKQADAIMLTDEFRSALDASMTVWLVARNGNLFGRPKKEKGGVDTDKERAKFMSEQPARIVKQMEKLDMTEQDKLAYAASLLHAMGLGGFETAQAKYATLLATAAPTAATVH